MDRTPVSEVLAPAQQINQLDSTGADRLGKLNAELPATRIVRAFAEVKSRVREKMHLTGLDAKTGADHFHRSIDEGVRAFVQRQEQTLTQGKHCHE